MENKGAKPSYTKRARETLIEFSDFDAESLLQEPFLHDSSDKLDIPLGSDGQSPALDCEQKSTNHKTELSLQLNVALTQARANLMESIRMESLQFQKRQGLSPYKSTVRQIGVYPTSRGSFDDDFHPDISESELSAQSQQHQLFTAASPSTPPNLLNHSFLESKNRIEAAFDHCGVQETSSPNGFTLPGSTSTQQNQLSTQLEHMEKLCDSMRKSAVTRDLIKRLSIPGASQTPVDEIGKAAPPEMVQSDCQMSFPSGSTSVRKSGGRGNRPGFAVSGRGRGRVKLGRRLSNNSVSSNSKSPAWGAKEETRKTARATDDRNSMTFSETPYNLNGRRHSSSIQLGQASPKTQRKNDRSIKRRRSNPILTLKLINVEDGSMDASFDGEGDNESV